MSLKTFDFGSLYSQDQNLPIDKIIAEPNRQRTILVWQPQLLMQYSSS